MVASDGLGGINPESKGFFKTATSDTHPWLQIDYGRTVEVSMVMVIADYKEYKTGRDMTVNVGGIPAIKGELMTSGRVCSNITGYLEPSSYKMLECPEILHGRYVVIQTVTDNQEHMILNEVYIFTGKF